MVGSILAAHRARWESPNRRKLERNPVTPGQPRLYRLLLWGVGLLFIFVMMGTTA